MHYGNLRCLDFEGTRKVEKGYKVMHIHKVLIEEFFLTPRRIVSKVPAAV